MHCEASVVRRRRRASIRGPRTSNAISSKVLLVDGVLTGYALFEEEGKVNYLLHPRDGITGVKYSSLAMIHSILEDLFDPEQLQQHLRLIDLRSADRTACDCSIAR